MARQSYVEWNKRARREELLAGEKYVEHTSPSSFIGKVLMVFPGDYGVGMANLGYQHVMRLWQREGFEVDRLFLDDTLEEDWSFEKEYPLDSFDIIAISFPFEGGLVRLIPFLEKLKTLPSHPIVVLGGATTYFNPFIVSDYVDYVIVGDGEGAIHSLVEHISSGGKLPPWIIKPGDTSAFVHKLLNLTEPAYSLIVPKESVFENFFLIEIGRGCHVGCRFCVYGYTYRPIRQFSPEEIVSILRAKQISTDTVGLISASLSLHREPIEVAMAVIDMGYRPVPSSLHVNESSPELISLLARSGNRSMTFAVEHGDRAFQKKLGKDVDPEHLNILLKAGVENGLKSIKLYFIMGLGEDPVYNASAGVEFVKRAIDGISGLKVTVSFSVLVPKPWTPFEKQPFPKRAFVKKEISAWNKFVRQYRLPVQLILPSYKEAFEEYALSRFSGDLAYRYVVKGESLKHLVEEANDKMVWKNIRHIDPMAILDVEYHRYLKSEYPLGCQGDCSSCVVKSLDERGDSLV